MSLRMSSNAIHGDSLPVVTTSCRSLISAPSGSKRNLPKSSPSRLNVYVFVASASPSMQSIVVI